MTWLLIPWVLSIAIALTVGWAIPAWAMKRLVPVLEGSGNLVTNYRGRRIPTGLGLVWLVWTAAVGAAAALVMAARTVPAPWSGVLRSPAMTVPTMLPLLLVAGAFAFGFVDDVYGAGSAKGFRGHLRAMGAGRITTGGLKLLGIGLLAVLAATQTRVFDDSLAAMTGSVSAAGVLLAFAAWACATLVIALSANLVNLMDLRPGRAIKAYGALSVISLTILFLSVMPAVGLASSSTALAVFDAKMPGVVLAILLLGPVVAVWRYDLGERAMLGDGGANAMGALAGFFLAQASPLWLLAVVAATLLVLNLASERVSFSRVIDRVGFLKWIDGLGRLPAEQFSMDSATDQMDGERTGGSAADDAGKDGGTSKR